MYEENYIRNPAGFQVPELLKRASYITAETQIDTMKLNVLQVLHCMFMMWGIVFKLCHHPTVVSCFTFLLAMRTTPTLGSGHKHESQC